MSTIFCDRVTITQPTDSNLFVAGAVASRCWSFRTGKDIEGAVRQFSGEQ